MTDQGGGHTREDVKRRFGLDDEADIASRLADLNVEDLKQLATALRRRIIEVVSRNGGHLASNLGVVELTLALHACFDFKRDRLVWDVGHQGYAHKLITGRWAEFDTLRQKGRIGGFVDPLESPYDAFHFGHTGTSIGAALGLACGYAATGEARRVVAVIGDGAIASGMPFEALNHAGELDPDLLIILNDNGMSISRSVGGLARWFRTVKSGLAPVQRRWDKAKELVAPLFGEGSERSDSARSILRKVNDRLARTFAPGALFSALGLNYYGPVDGHDLGELVSSLTHLRSRDGPRLLHVLTEKGRGFEPASTNPSRFHSSPRFDRGNGVVRVRSGKGRSWSDAFGEALVDLARDDERVVAITAAMPDGTGLTGFAQKYPDRFYDVGICEQHAVGLANGLAAAGARPVVAIYSTFLQRAFDQLFHDISLQDACVTFCLDRAGLVGRDGPTHHGLFDIAYCAPLPGLAVMAPKDEPELRSMLRLCVNRGGPGVIRYPRENVLELNQCDEQRDIALGEAETLREGSRAAIIAYGAMVPRALHAAQLLSRADGLDITILNARFAKPIDAEALSEVVAAHEKVFIVEDHAQIGGFGTLALASLQSRGAAHGGIRLLGVPDRPIAHAPREEQLADLQLDAAGLARSVRDALG